MRKRKVPRSYMFTRDTNVNHVWLDTFKNDTGDLVNVTKGRERRRALAMRNASDAMYA